MSGNQEWLDLTAEETLEPELPICDAHTICGTTVIEAIRTDICWTKSWPT